MGNFFTTSDGTKIFYSINGDGETIVFIHGFSLNNSMWEDQIKYFAKKFMVITYDMRGFGKSSMPKGKYSHMDDLKELLGFLDIKKCSVVGLSMGGEMAIDFTLEYPKMVNKLIVVDSSCGGIRRTFEWEPEIEKLGLVGTKDKWLNHEIFAYSINKSTKIRKIMKDFIDNYSGWHWLNKDLRKRLSNPLSKNRLDRIKQKTLIIVGEHDLSYYHNIALYLNKHIEHSKKVIIPDAGHMVNLDNTRLFNTVVEEFLLDA